MRTEAHLRNLSKNLLQACKQGSLSSVRLTAPLLYPTAKPASLPGTVPLRAAVATAARYGRADVLQYMLSLPASKASKEPWNPDMDDSASFYVDEESEFDTSYAEAVPMRAAESGSVEVMQALMDAGMSVNIMMEKMGTPIVTAIYRQHVPLIKFLLENGAPAHDYEWFPGESLLANSARFEKLDIMKLLLEHGAKANDNSSMRAAAEEGNIPALKLLMQHGAHIDEPYFQYGDVEGSNYGTPLHWAVIAEQVGTVKFLLDNGARTDLKDWQGDTARDIAVNREKDCPELGKLIDEANAKRRDQS